MNPGQNQFTLVYAHDSNPTLDTGQSEWSWFVDITAPTLSITSPVDASHITQPFTISGDAEPGTTVHVFDGVPTSGIEITPSGGIAMCGNTEWNLNLVTLNPEGVHTITAQAVDGAGNSATDEVTITADTTHPRILSFDPTDNAVGVSVNTQIGVTFDEAIDPATIETPGATAFTLSGPSGNIPGTVTLSQDGISADFVPTLPLDGSTTYTATVEGTSY